MDFTDELKKIASNVSQTVSSSLDKIKDSVNNKLNNTNIVDNLKKLPITSNNISSSIDKLKDSVSEKLKNSNILHNIKNKIDDLCDNIKDSNHIFLFPKIEIIVNKYSKDSIPRLQIEDYEKKYVVNDLAKIIGNFTDQEKASLYFFIGKKIRKLANCRSSGILDTYEIAMDYLDKALLVNPKNKELANELFDICNEANFSSMMGRGVKVAEFCIQNMEKEDSKDRYCQLYSFLGKYFYLEKNDYRKAIGYYLKALEYSEKDNYYYINSNKYLAILYDHLGEYKEALDYIKQIRKFENEWSEIREIRTDLQDKVARGITKEQEDERIFKSNMNYEFRACVGKYPEEILIEAYKHYLNASELIKQKNRIGAIEEYKTVKNMLPEMAKYMNELIDLHLSLCSNEEKNENHYEELFKTLNERLEIALKTNNRRDLCNVYNEMAIAYGECKKYEKAVETYKKAIDIAGIVSLYGVNLAKCLEDMELFDSALKVYEDIQNKNSDYANQFKIAYKISHIKDIQEGRIGKNGEDYSLAKTHCQQGNIYFNVGEYEEAFNEYNAALEIRNNSSDYVFRKLMAKQMYDSQYADEASICFDGLKIAENNDDFTSLPFLFTVYGDSITYESWGHSEGAMASYEIAVHLLNNLPSSKRFAAPYYKLGRLKEYNKEYKEALLLFEQAKEIDSSYRIESDIRRVRSELEDGGTSNKANEKRLVGLAKDYLKSCSYEEVINASRKALDFSPNNVEIYYLICQAAEQKQKYYELKWAAKEGLRLSISNFDRSEDYFEYFMFWLGKCSKYERKLKQAEIYFDIIVECDEYHQKEITKEAEKELYSIRYLER